MLSKPKVKQPEVNNPRKMQGRLAGSPVKLVQTPRTTKFIRSRFSVVDFLLLLVLNSLVLTPFGKK